MAEISFARIFKRGFGGLFNAAGRDDRSQFWIFGAMVFGPLIAVQMIAQMLLIFASFDLRELAASGADPAAAQLRMMADMGDGMITGTYLGVGLCTIGAACLLTATARRLHDRGRSGWWALVVPFVVVATGIYQIRRVAWTFEQMASIAADMRKIGTVPDSVAAIQAQLQASAPGPDWLAIAAGLAMLWLVIELVRAGSDGPNRFGPAPE